MKDFSRLVPLICGFSLWLIKVLSRPEYKTIFTTSQCYACLVACAVSNDCDTSKHLVTFCSLHRAMFSCSSNVQDLSFSISIFDHHLPLKHKELRDCLSFSLANTHSQSPLNDCWPKANVTHQMSISRRIQMVFFALCNRCGDRKMLFDNCVITRG